MSSTGRGGWILLTSAVRPDPAFTAPNSSFMTVVHDPAVRVAQYRDALRYWQGVAVSTDARVAIVDTSGASRDDFGLAARDNVIVIGHRPDPALASLGKGAFEASAIDAALGAIDAAGDAPLCKVTGRLQVRQASSIVGPVPPGVVRIRRSLDRSFCDTRFIQTTVSQWQSVLSDMATLCDDSAGRWLERVVAHRLSVAEFSGRTVVERFPRRIVLVGQSGTTGQTYGTWWESRIPEVVLRKLEGAARRRLARLEV